MQIRRITIEGSSEGKGSGFVGRKDQIAKRLGKTDADAIAELSNTQLESSKM